MTLGIGLLWLVPYMQSASAHFYEDVKAEYEAGSGARGIKSSRIHDFELPTRGKVCRRLFYFLILPTFVIDKQIDIKIEWEKEGN